MPNLLVITCNSSGNIKSVKNQSENQNLFVNEKKTKLYENRPYSHAQKYSFWMCLDKDSERFGPFDTNLA